MDSQKLLIDVLEGRGAIFGNLFCKRDNNPSGNRKLVSRGLYMVGVEYNHYYLELWEEYQENLCPCYFF